MAATLADLSAGHPDAPLYLFMDHAAWWADFACEAELKAYCLACYNRLSPRSRAAFLAHVQKVAA